jgi:Ca-activated chloride channel family protein
MSDLSFLAPARLLLLVLPLALAGLYGWLQRRRRAYAVRFTNVDLLDKVAPDRPGWRRHLPALALLAGVVVATLAFARPAVAGERASRDTVVVLALDTSLSMQATDVTPSRVDAAKRAATTFLDAVPAGVKVGIVGFDGQARPVLSPTDNLDAAKRAVERLDLGEGTAIGEAVYTALDEIANVRSEDDGERADGDDKVAAVVLLSDGETTQGRPNEEAAREADRRGVAVSTIAFGTDRGEVTAPDGTIVQVPVNRQALRDLAETTGGTAFDAQSASELQRVFENIGATVTTEPVQREVSDWFAGVAVVLLVLAATGSLLWFSRLP